MSTVSLRPQLNRDDLARLQWLLGTTVAVLSASTVFFLDVQAWWLVAAIGAAAVAGVCWPAWPARVPTWVHRLAFPIILGTFAFDLFFGREPLPALIRLDLLLILYRLISHRSRREDLQLLVLGLFLIVVAGVLSVSIAFAGQILAFAACSLLFLFVITLAGEHPPAPPAGTAPSWTRGRSRDLWPRIRAATDWRLVVLATALFGGMVVLSGLLFLAIPRFEFNNGLFLDRLINRKTLTGFSDTIRFGDVTSITKDTSLALMVDVEDPAALPPVPYWRMVVLDDYTGGGFAMSPELRRELAARSRPRSSVSGTAAPPAEPGRALTLYLEPGVSRYLPLPGNFHHLQFTEAQTFGVDRIRRVLALERDPPKMLAYRLGGWDGATMVPEAGFAAVRTTDPTRQPTVLAVPVSSADRARLERIAAELEGTTGPLTALEFAARVTDWLERHHAYSLESVLPPGSGDPLVRWLDSNTPGHCELFAGALVMLARTAGHPARLVTGFKGGTWNAYSNSLAVRNTNAHAWCEIFDADSGAWVRVDPTPGAEAAARIAEESGDSGRRGRVFDTGWMARLESLRVFWYRRIVNFDQDSQIEFAVAAKEAVQSVMERWRGWVDRHVAQVHQWLAQPWGLDRLFRSLLLVVGVVALVVAWRRLGRGWWLRWRSAHLPHGGDPVRREAGRWLQRLAKRQAGTAAVPADVRDALVRLRYGSPRSWPDPATVFRAARRANRRQR
jgi:protein-glutamine gamma-glutamyltransferase